MRVRIAPFLPTTLIPEPKRSFAATISEWAERDAVQFYDKILPQFANKYVKKWGSKVEDINVNSRAPGDSAWQGGRGEHPFQISSDVDHPERGYQIQRSATGETLATAHDYDEAHAKVAELMAQEDPGTPVHSVRITPEMRESVMRGQPLFERQRAAAESEGLKRPVLLDDIVAELPHNPSAKERAVIAQVTKIANRIVPKAEVMPATRLMPHAEDTKEAIGGNTITGVTTMGAESQPVYPPGPCALYAAARESLLQPGICISGRHISR